MRTPIGVWIDHRRAIVVGAAGAGDDILELQSNADWHRGRTAGAVGVSSHEAQGAPEEEVLDRRFPHLLNGYYDRIIALIGQAPSLFIFGPGEAKGELRARLQQEIPAHRTVYVETADKMSDPQIAAKVRQHFAS